MTVRSLLVASVLGAFLLPLSAPAAPGALKETAG